MNRQAERRGPIGRFLRFITTIILCPIILLWLLVVALYLPPIQEYAVDKVCHMASEKTGFDISIGRFNLKFPFKITIDDFNISKGDSAILDGKQIEIDINTLPLLKGEVEVNYISIDNTLVNSQDIIDGVHINGKIGHFRITIRNIDLDAKRAMIRHLHIVDTHADITADIKPQEEDSTTTPIDWTVGVHRTGIRNIKIDISMPTDSITLTSAIDRMTLRGADIDLATGAFKLKNMRLKDSRIYYDRGTQSDSVAPLDHQHIDNIDIETGAIRYSAQELNAEIKSLTMMQKNGMNINKGRIILSSDSTALNLQTLTLSTAHGTNISASGTMPLTMLKGEEAGRMYGTLDIHLDKRDLRKFLKTSLYNQLHTLPDSMMNVQLQLHGNLNTIHLDTLNVNVPGLTNIGMGGTAYNLHNSNLLRANAHINGNIYDLGNIINKAADTDSLAPQPLRLQGTASIEQKLCSLALRARSKKGRTALRANYNIADNSYNARLRVKRLDISDILPDIPLKELTMWLNVQGTGLNPLDSTTQYNCNLRIDTLRYDSIFLQGIHLAATQYNNTSNVQINTLSPTLQMTFRAQTRLDSIAISNSSQLIVTKANLQSMGLTKAELDAALTINAKLFTDLKQTHRATINGDNFRLITKRKTFTPARLELSAYTSPDTSYIKATTGDLKIDGTLDTGYTTMLESFNNLATLYAEAATSPKTLYYIQDYKKKIPTLTLNIDCGQNNILANFLRFNQVEFNNFDLRLSIDSLAGINGRGGIYNLKRGDIQLDTIHFSLRQKDEKLRYFAGVRTRSLDPARKNLKFYSALFGNLHNDSLTTNFIFRDNNDNVGARIKLNTLLMPKELHMHFSPEATLFNRPFTFNKNNYITLGKKLAVRADVELKDTINSGLRIYSSKDTTQLRDISLELFNIDLKTASATIPYAPDMAGTLNMDLHYRDNGNDIMLSSDIHGNNVHYEGNQIGNETIEIAYFPKNNKKHYLDIGLWHNDKYILNIYGDYHSDSIRPHIKAQADIMRFPLQLSDAFLNNSGLELDGYIDGKLAVTGPIDNAEANGSIKFDSVYAHAPMFGTRLHLKDGAIDIVDNKLTFDNFDIYAHGKAPFQVNGTIDLRNLKYPYFDLSMRAKDYELVNARRNNKSMLYGRLFLNLNSMLRGPINALQMNGSATMLGKSDITYVMNETPLSADNELDGLVQFVNFADTTQMAKKEEKKADFGNLTMNMRIDIEEAARINADFDIERKSYIELQGGGNLNMTYSSEAGLGLTGRYTLNNGQLKYALPIIPLKTLNISEGSYVNWTGNMMNPTLEITALERTSTSVTMEDGSSQAVTFNVGVVLTNTLDDMGISFILSAPDNAQVQSELNALDKETMNKYAVTMLITGAYIGNNGGITVSSALSSFLDATINDIAGDAMKSVDINVGITDVENSETGGTYKNYSFSFAKRFWNDRLTVIIGGEVNSGDVQKQNDSFINNVSLEWKINEAGNRYLRLFYDKNYESILEGEIIETGVGYVYKRKLDNLNELLIIRKKDDSEELIITPRQNKSEDNRNNIDR